MATIEWMDGFDHYYQEGESTMSGDMALKWTGASGGQNRYIRGQYARQPGGQGIYLVTGGSARYVYKTLPNGSQATRCYAFGFRTAASPTSGCLVAFLDSGSEQISLRFNGSSQLIVNRGGTTLATSTNTMSIDTWYWIEFKTTINGSTGSIEVRVNGTSTNWIPATGSLNTQATGNASANYFSLGSPSLQFLSGFNYDDVVVADDFVGVGQIITIRPQGPGSQSDWTPNYASNYSCVKEVGTLEYERSMNTTTTANNIDLFPFERIPSGATIGAIQHCITHRQDAGAARTIRRVQKRSGSSYYGSNIAQGTGWAMETETLNTDPSTGAAWTVTNLNNAEFGYELVS